MATVPAAAVLVLMAAVAVLVDDDGGHPDEWDARVVDLVDFVERERGLTFDHPVEIEFLGEEDYSARTRVDEGELTDEDRAALDESGAALQALGLVPPGTDMLDTSNEMADTGTLAYYDPTTETVVVRGTEMSTHLRVTLVHELVHAAQDQAFDLEPILESDSAGAYEGYRALVEGDASRVETSYVESLPADEQQEYSEEYAVAYDDASRGLEQVPGGYQALFGAPYALGLPFVQVIAEDGGNEGVDEAFRDPPASAEHLFTPPSYFAGDDPREVDAPTVPVGAERLGPSTDLGAIGLFVMLSERIDALTALDAADGWGGDRAVAYAADGDVCVRLHLVGDTAEDTGQIAAALRSWAGAGDPGTVHVEVSDVVELESCVPEDAVATEDTSRSATALGLVAMRSQFMVGRMVDGGADRDEAFAFGDCVVHRFPLDTLEETEETGQLPPDVLASVDTIVAECISA